MEIKTYAPVVIATLNRINHLQRCISSLQANTHADKTELYIALDYPPSQKYIEGYKQISAFLEKPIEGFKDVHIIRRDKNYGAIINSVDISKKVLGKYDRIIVLEDDNELAPNFLDFCNKGLELYESDESIIALNASSYVWCGNGMKTYDSKEQGIKKRQLIFHGYATWKNRYNIVTEWCESYRILEDGLNLKLLLKLRLKSRCFFYSFIENVMCNRNNLPWINGKIYKIDQIWDYYMIMFDKYIICPEISLIRDLGCDGSGANFKEAFENIDQVLGVKLDSNKTFNAFKRDDIPLDKREIKLHDIHNYNRPKCLLNAWKCCGKMIFKVISKK